MIGGLEALAIVAGPIVALVGSLVYATRGERSAER